MAAELTRTRAQSVPRGGAAVADVVIVGAGPAGLALAIRARQLGLDVAIVDGGQPGRDKACGEGLMPLAVRELAALGVTLEADACRAFAGISFVQCGAEGATVERADLRFGGASGLGVRRTVLHETLARRAEAVDARVRWGVVTRGLMAAGGEGCRGIDTDAGAIPARFVVGADGLHSHVRRWAGLGRGPGRRRRYGIRRHFAMRPWTDLVEVHWARGAEAFATPVSSGLVGVNVTWDGTPSSFDELMARFPALGCRLAGASIASDDRGMGPLHQRVVAVRRGNVALVGDAAGYVDSITGEGIGLAFRQAAELAHALWARDLARYEVAHRRIVRRFEWATRALLLLARHPALRQRVIAGLATRPRLATTLLDAACGARQFTGVRGDERARAARPSEGDGARSTGVRGDERARATRPYEGDAGADAAATEFTSPATDP